MLSQNVLAGHLIKWCRRLYYTVTDKGEEVVVSMVHSQRHLCIYKNTPYIIIILEAIVLSAMGKRNNFHNNMYMSCIVETNKCCVDILYFYG